MWVASLAVLTLILGLILGFYARDLYDKITGMYELYKDRLETPPGVVKPVVTRGQARAQLAEPIDLGIGEDDSPGGVMRPSPTQATLQQLADESIAHKVMERRQRVKRL
jgi:hypothetical protein